MALFKILRGNSANLNSTPFHDGYAYFTHDDGGFYIDSEVDGVQKRTQINKPGGSTTAINATLLASAWSSGQQTLQIEGVSASSNGVAGVAQEISDAAMESAKEAELYVSGQGEGTVTITVFGETPTRDIPVVVILFG